MATRAATFTAKIRNLKDYHYRMTNHLSPLPSGVDVANTLKYFSQTLLNVLRDVPGIPQESYGPRQRDSIRLSVFPSLNYSGLYEAVMNILEVFTTVQQGQHALGESILHVFGCLVPFLEYDLLDTLPYTVASTLAIFSPSLHKDAVELLCTNLLPVTLGYTGMNENTTYATDAAAAIMMLVFQYVTEGGYHSQIVECIMGMKKNICQDLLNVIAYGPPSAKAPAVNHLFHYWPQLNPALTDRRGIHYKYLGWEAVCCQRDKCPNKGETKAAKMCLDPAIAIKHGERSPPLYVCQDCSEQLRQENAQFLVDILRPLQHVSITCENKNCKSPKNGAYCTCFSIECASLNGNRPIRYCQGCHKNKHGCVPGSHHVFHLTIPDIWACPVQLQSYLVEAIVSLMKEAQPMEEKRNVEMGEERLRQHFDDEVVEENEDSDERKLLSRYGIWLLVETGTPRDDIPIEVLGRLLAMLFQWFDATAYLPDDNVGNALERLKPQYITKWLKEISRTHFEVILSCLLPHPVEYARVGGHWDTMSSRTTQIKEGLNRLCCLVPYDVVVFEVWDYVIPFWLEAIRTEVPEEERHELKVLVSKIFAIDMSPLPFNVEKMYHFMAERFDHTTAPVQEQNLQWLQILASLDIITPLGLLLEMFKIGVTSLAYSSAKSDESKPQLHPSVQPNVTMDDFPSGSPLSPNRTTNGNVFTFTVPRQEDDHVPNITCFIMMLDVVLKQIELQEATEHLGINNETSKGIMELITEMLNTKWEGTHSCDGDEEVTNCSLCDVSALWHHLAMQTMEFVAPSEELELPHKDLPKVDNVRPRAVSDQKEKQDQEIENKDKVDSEPKHDLSKLPVHLQLLHALLKTLDDMCDADSLYQLLHNVKLLCLHADCLNYSVKEHQEFVTYCLKNLMIPNLWKLLQADHSQIATMCVPLLLHCVTLPDGADILWNLVEDDFSSEEWRARFSAVEKATVLARLLDPESVHNNQQIMTCLAHIFSFLIGALSDIHSAVVQRTMLYLDTIKTSSIKCLCRCLEFQFDSVIRDRTMILQRLQMLATVLPSQNIFSWEFFLNRFDTLCLEAQLDLESNGDIASLTDLRSSDRQSDQFLHKINRARFALARTTSIRSVSGSILNKPPYRRASSVPVHLLTKSQHTEKMKEAERDQDIKELKPFLNLLIHQDSDKVYPRQQSAPQFGRSRGSRFGLGMFSTYLFPDSGGNLHEFTDEQTKYAALLQKAMDLEGVDRDTLHQLVSLLMKFMLHTVQDEVNDDRNESRAQNIVLRHLNVLLGYIQTDRVFSVPPYKVRSSAVFNAYLSLLPQVLDRNFTLGNIILPVSMMLLQYSPSPQRYASDYQPPNYSLWFLEPHTRQSWLNSLLVILYKYQYNTSPASGTIQFLVQLVSNTIDAQLHRCKKRDDTFGQATPMVPRNRDTSNVSMGDLENILETDTPPQSPSDSQPSAGEGCEAVTISMTSPSGTTIRYRRRQDSDRADDTDVESLNASSKLASPASRASSNSSRRTPSPPRPSSPTDHVHMEAGILASPTKVLKGSVSTPPNVSSPTEAVALFSKDQPKRIAEYGETRTQESHSTFGDPPNPLRKQMTEPALKYTPFQQRTLEQSVEEFMLGQSKGRSMISVSQSPGQSTGVSRQTSLSSPIKSPQRDVDKKIVEQILEFESQNGNRKKGDFDQNKHGIAREVTSDFNCKIVNEARGGDTSLTGNATDTAPSSIEASPVRSPAKNNLMKGAGRKKDLPHLKLPKDTDSHLQVKPISSVLEEVKESDEDYFPKKSPLTKMKSEELRSKHVEGHAEFVGLRRPRTERTLSEQNEGEFDRLDPHIVDSELEDSPCTSPTPQLKLRPQFRQRKARKTGLTTIELQKQIPELSDLAAGFARSAGRRSSSAGMPKTSWQRRRRRRARRSELVPPSLDKKRSVTTMRSGGGEHLMVDKCGDCGVVLEAYDEETISLCIVCLATFIHREPSLSAPLLLNMLQSVTRIAASTTYPWQTDISGLIIPGNCVSVARQFLRCTLHQLAPNGIFTQLFQTEIDDPDMLKTIAAALLDFSELNCHAALLILLEGVNESKTMTSEQILQVTQNLASFLDHLPLESGSPNSSSILAQFELFFRRLPLILQPQCCTEHLLKVMVSVLKMPGLISAKTILEPFAKVLSFIIQNCSFKLQQLMDICSFCSRAFSKERDKLLLSRTVVFELVQALKFKITLPDDNLLVLVQFVCVDAGGTIGPTNIVEDLAHYSYNPYTQSLISTNAADCMKQHLGECVEFVADIHTITKSNVKCGGQNLNEDTLGSHLKAGIAQFVALEFTRGNGRDNRAISRYLPWLYHPPSTMQQGPREFIDCVSHIRLLSWLLLGSLSHTAITKASGPIMCQPLPLEASSYIADHIMVILSGFAEQSKTSVLHMSSLFHAFILCQLWTMYCESYMGVNSVGADLANTAQATIMDFWARVTPGILQLLSHSKMTAEMVYLHFLGLMEALQECNSSVLSKFFPVWTPILFSYHSQLPGHMQVRLQMCQNWQPREISAEGTTVDSDVLLKWLKRLQFKLGQIEVQSSAATQFYTV